jgi:hypothetical protein
MSLEFFSGLSNQKLYSYRQFRERQKKINTDDGKLKRRIQLSTRINNSLRNYNVALNYANRNPYHKV